MFIWPVREKFFDLDVSAMRKSLATPVLDRKRQGTQVVLKKKC